MLFPYRSAALLWIVVLLKMFGADRKEASLSAPWIALVQSVGDNGLSFLSVLPRSGF